MRPTGEKIRLALRLDRTLRFVWNAAPGAFLLSATLVFFTGLIPLATLYLIKLIVDAAGNAIQPPAGGDTTAHITAILILVGLAAGVGLTGVILRQIMALAKEVLSLKISDHVYDLLHRKSISMDLSFYENPAYFDSLHRAQMEGPYRPAKIVEGLIQLGQNSVSFFAVGGLLITLHWFIPLILLLAVVPGIIVRLRYSGKLYQWQRQRTGMEREGEYLNWLITGSMHAKELRLFETGGMFADAFSAIRRILRNERIALSRKRAVADTVAQMGTIAAVFGILAFIVIRAVAGIISIGSLVMYYQAVQRGLDYFRAMLEGLAGLYEDNLFIAYFYDFLDMQETIIDPPQPASIPETIQKGITFENINFRYPLSGKAALADINFSIAPGEVIALVGGNGAGKSTLVKLLCRLYDPETGVIRIDGTDIRQFPISDLRKKIGVMFQDYAKYQFTARKNIWMGDIQAALKSPAVEEAATGAGADTMISELPEGYETILGKLFEGGTELSEGQWQKIALARAFMRNAKLIILDEPASSLDATSEYEIFRNFRTLIKGKSAVLISHRYSTVKMADRIVVINKGRIVEQGTHADLLQNGGYYTNWFEKQSLVAGTGM
ncbi:MAG: ABC transporter ATP-binding protein [Thermodesulfobacteriota bacterium]|nr:ABC transporter ATP-binding protein [Thermodesulfobacteriota bacterium]